MARINMKPIMLVKSPQPGDVLNAAIYSIYRFFARDFVITLASVHLYRDKFQDFLSSFYALLQTGIG